MIWASNFWVSGFWADNFWVGLTQGAEGGSGTTTIDGITIIDRII